MVLAIIGIIILIGFLIFIKSEINSRFDHLENKFREISHKLDQLKVQEKSVEKPPIAIGAEKPFISEKPLPTPEIPIPTAIGTVPKPAPIPETNVGRTVFSMESAAAPKPVQPVFERKPYIPEKTWWETFKEKNPDLEKFIGENLINKIGVLILVLGISYFVKFAIDKDWINEPARVGIGVLCGALVMAFAHKLRKNYAAFSSVLVAGAIAIFYFTIAIAFHDYKLFGQTAAFLIMVVITAFSSLISLSYDRKELAVLSLIGGFAVPFMVSTGEGNYVVLFSYILILNIGILAIAYHKKWSIVTILSYVFTVLLFGAWLIKDIYTDRPHYTGALVFGFVFYLVFILMTIINNLRTKGVFTTVELTILISNTFLFYTVGMVVLSNYHPETKGLFTVILALLNLTYAWFLYKKFGLDKTAVYLLIGLTLTFITLAVPIQFEGNNITLFWAAEAVLLLWLSQKSAISSYRFASVIVQLLMLVSLFMDWGNGYSGSAVLNIALNAVFMTGLFAVVSMVSVYYLLRNETEKVQQFGLTFNPVLYRNLIGIAAIIIGYLTGLLEVYCQSDNYISGQGSQLSIPTFYHLLFTAVFVYFLYKSKKNACIQFAVFIAVANIVAYTFMFSGFSFSEHADYIESGAYQRIAFYFHYLSLATIIYFAWQLYRIRKNEAVNGILGSNLFIWFTAFFTVYIASSELMLHALVLSNSPITAADIASDPYVKTHSYETPEMLRRFVANEAISSVRNQIIRSGFPVLWGVFAFLFLIAGIKKQIKTLRIAALTLLGITILKLFVFDIRNASQTGKIIAFILLGVVILVISFVYQKIKVLVTNDKSGTPNEDE